MVHDSDDRTAFSGEVTLTRSTAPDVLVIGSTKKLVAIRVREGAGSSSRTIQLPSEKISSRAVSLLITLEATAPSPVTKSAKSSSSFEWKSEYCFLFVLRCSRAEDAKGKGNGVLEKFMRSLPAKDWVFAAADGKLKENMDWECIFTKKTNVEK